MALQLFQFDEFPNKIAVSKIDSFVTGGVFLLDFSRPIQIQRWLGISNNWIGISLGILVHVVHQSEEHGGYLISVEKSDSLYKEFRALWKQRYPSKKHTPSNLDDGLKIITDFAAQFPEDSQ